MKARDFLNITLPIVVAAALIVGINYQLEWWPFLPTWPEFPATEKSAPAIVAKPDLRDYGYRTGDVVPVTIYIKQYPGAKVDMDSLVFEGSFSIRDQPDVFIFDAGQGISYIRWRTNLQSLNVGPVQSSKLSLTWISEEDKEIHEAEQGVIEVHTSMTYDGRDKLQDGPLAIWQGYHLLISASCLGFGFIGLVMSTLHYRQLIKAVPPSPTRVKLAKQRFDEVWAKIEAGDRSESNFQEIEFILRDIAGIKAIPLTELQSSLGTYHPQKVEILHVVEYCERVVFEHQALTDGELEILESSFGRFIKQAAYFEFVGSLENQTIRRRLP